MGARDIKSHQAKALKTKSNEAHRKMSPLNGAKIPPNNAVNDAVCENPESEDRITPVETEHDRVLSNKKHDEDEKLPQEIEEDWIPCNPNMARTEFRQSKKELKTMTKT